MQPHNSPDAEKVLNALHAAGKTRVVAVVDQKGWFTVYQSPYKKSGGYSPLKPKSHREKVCENARKMMEFKRIAELALGRRALITMTETKEEVSNASV